MQRSRRAELALAVFALGGGVVAAGCSHRPVDYGGVAVLEGSVRRASRASAAIERGAAAVAIIETDVARGMGFVIDPAGYLLTNRHVIEDADHIEGVVFPARDPSRVYGSVRVVYIDPERDLALLHVHSNEPLTAVPLATDGFGPVSSYLADADPVVLLQREPGQGDQPQSLQLQHGEVSRLEVEYPAAGPGPFVGVTADVRQGQSGGPVLDRHGRAVGIVTWTWRRGGGGFAIPIDDATRMLEQRPQLELEADRRSRARLRARLFLDAIARGDGSTARRFTSPSQARKRRGQTVDEIMGNAQQGRGLQVMQGYVAALEEVVAKVVEAEDPQLAAVGLDVLVRGVIEAPFRDALGVRGSLEIGQVISFFHELGEGYLHARVYGGQGSEDALRSALQRLQTIDASRSFALAELAVALDERQAQVRSVELVPGAYIDGARIELELRGADGRTERVDLRLRLEWGDWYVASVEPSALG